MNRKITVIFLAGLLLPALQSVNAQTGTRIDEAVGNRPGNVIWFNEPQEVLKVKHLLQAGRKQDAIKLARNYVGKVEKISGYEATVRLYFGLNALCSALMSNGDLDEAIDNCNRAIELYPSRWQAFNNRGTAYYLSGNYEQAMQDYNHALQNRPDSEIIRHNIQLTESKIADNR